MLGIVDSLLSNGALLHLGEAFVDAVSSTVHSVTHFFDLPVNVSSLESSLRFVKTSGFENENAVPVIASVGLKIGGARMADRKGSPIPSSASSSSALLEADASGPEPPLNGQSSAKIGFDKAL